MYSVFSYNRELEVSFSPLVDIQNPFFMRVKTVRGQANNLDVPLLKIRGMERDLCELRGADRCEVIWVGEKNGLNGDGIKLGVTVRPKT